MKASHFLYSGFDLSLHIRFYTDSFFRWQILWPIMDLLFLPWQARTAFVLVLILAFRCKCNISAELSKFTRLQIEYFLEWVAFYRIAYHSINLYATMLPFWSSKKTELFSQNPLSVLSLTFYIPKGFLQLYPIQSTLLFRFTPYFVETTIAGIDDDGKPFIANSDTIGCMTEPFDFVVSGTATDNLLGVCETFW